MSGKRGKRRDSEIFRRKVRELLLAGYGVSAIVKATGKTPLHVTRIVEQERDWCIQQVATGAAQRQGEPNGR